MKIIDLSSYEKLKIRPVSFGNLDGGIDLSLEKVDLMKQSYWTIEPGWIVKIRWKKSIWMVFDSENLIRLFDDHSYYIGKWLVGMEHGSYTGLNYFRMDIYKSSFPDQKTNLMTVTGVLKTNVDIENFKTKDDLIFFFDKYNDIIYANI